MANTCDYDLILNAFLNDLSGVKEALQSNIDINMTRELRGDPDIGKATALIFSSYSGGLEVVEYLVQLSADVNARDSVSKRTALEWAIKKGHSAVSTFLEAEIRRRELCQGHESPWKNEYTIKPVKGATPASVIPLEIDDNPDKEGSLVRMLESIGGCGFVHFFKDEMGIEEITDFYYVTPLNWNKIEEKLPPVKVNKLKAALLISGIPVNDSHSSQTYKTMESGSKSNALELFLTEEMPSAPEACIACPSSKQKALEERPDSVETLDGVQKAKHTLEPSPAVPRASENEDTPPEVSLCVICLENVRDILILPCKHICVCRECFHKNTVPTCPVCRGAVVTGIEVYF